MEQVFGSYVAFHLPRYDWLQSHGEEMEVVRVRNIYFNRPSVPLPSDCGCVSPGKSHLDNCALVIVWNRAAP